MAEHSFRARFCWCNSARAQGLQKPNMPSIERSLYLLNTRSICAIFLCNWTRCIEGLGLLLHPDNTNTVILNSLLFPTQNHFPGTFPSVIYHRLFRAPANFSFPLRVRNSGVQLYVTKGSDAKNPAILSFFFVTERTQLTAAHAW